MLIENLFNKLQINHHKKIVNYIKDFDIINIIDVGTHKGEFLQSCLNLEHVKKFYCFEPQISMISYLKKKLLNNKKIELFECALDSVVSKKKIYINELSSTSTLLEANKNSLYYNIKKIILSPKKNIPDTYYVNTNTLDNIFSEKDLSKSLLKIDVEGFELNVLIGSKNKISEINYILIENQTFNQYKENFNKNCHEFLIKNNFKIIKNFYFPTLHFKDVLYKKI